MIWSEKMELRIPGPTPVPPQVQRAIARNAVNHRGVDFKALFRRVTRRLAGIFGTESDVFLLTASGTGAMEAAVANLVSPGDVVVALVGGAFGERWARINEAFGAEVVRVEYPWSRGARPEELAAALDSHPEARVVFATHNESSTGVANRIDTLAQVCRERGALLVVDAVSSLGGMELPMDQWGVDAVVTGSQKCLMMPPGLSFIALSPRAWERVEEARGARFYFDLRQYRKSAGEGETPFTPALNLVFGLEAALDLLEAEGLPQIYQRHRLLREMTRAALRRLALPLFTGDEWASPTVTAVAPPEGFDVEGFRRTVRERTGVVLAGGQARLKGKIFRIGHMGYTTPLDILTTVAAIEVGLRTVGHPVEPGSGVAAAEEVWTG